MQFGDFTLASGKKSSYYVNSKKVLFHAEAISLLGDALFEATKDIDALLVPQTELRDAARAVSICGNLPEGWLNDAVKGFAPLFRFLLNPIQPQQRHASFPAPLPTTN